MVVAAAAAVDVAVPVLAVVDCILKQVSYLLRFISSSRGLLVNMYISVIQKTPTRKMVLH